MGEVARALVPKWARAWYMFNLIVLSYDATFVMFRPKGAIADVLFAPMRLYCEYDGAIGNAADRTVRSIYIIGFVDLTVTLMLLYKLVSRPRTHADVRVAILVASHSAQLLTKTAVYVLYSWPLLDAAYQVPITLMSSLWVAVPALLIAHVARAAANLPTAHKE